jgi:chromosome segregation ATPase
MRARAAELDAFGDRTDKAVRDEISQLRREAKAFEALASEETAINRRRAAELDLQIAQSQQNVRERNRAASNAEKAAGVEERATVRAGRELDKHAKQLETLNQRLANSAGSTTRFGRLLERVGLGARSAAFGMGGLNSEFQNFQIAVVIKYAQSLISALAALGGQLLVVAAAAAQAGASIGAALAAGAAQAVPVIGLLGAALLRVKNVLQAVKQQNQQQLTATQDATRAANAQRTAADQIRSSEQQVADAHRATQRAVQSLAQAQSDAARQEQRAQQQVTQARKDAIRTVQDLIAAEEQARLQVISTQAALRGSIAAGDVLGTAQNILGVGQARVGLQRAQQDAAPVRARGVEGVQAVQQAEQSLTDTRRSGARSAQQAQQSLTDARRNEARANEDLARTRKTAAENLAQETAAANKLTDMLKQLSPAERELYRRILAFQDVYKRVTQPITDIIVSAFSDVARRATQVIQDPRILGAARRLARQIAAQIRDALNFTTSGRNRGVIVTLTDEATRNLPQITRIFKSVFSTVRDVVLSALPAFRLLLRYADQYTSQLRSWTSSHRGDLRDFFVQGIRYANSFLRLALAVVRLLLTIAGRGGAAGQGIRTINDLTKAVDHLTRRAQANAGAIRRFFAQSHDAFFEILGVLGDIGKTLISSFNARSVKEFADFLRSSIIPAFGDTIKIMGALVTVFHQFLALPGVSTVVQLVATMLLLAKGMTIVHDAIGHLFSIFPNFLKAFKLLTPVVDEATGAVTGFELSAAGPIVLAIVAIGAAIYLLDKKFHFLGPTFKWLKRAASDAFDWIKGAAKDVAAWFSDVWNQGLLKWLRWPFQQFGQQSHLGEIFGAVIAAAKAVINFFTSPQQGAWGTLQKILMAPFHVFKSLIQSVFIVIIGIVKTFLDVLAGRWSAAGDALTQMFSGVMDKLAGLATGFLGIWSGILSALNKAPGFGWVKGAADAIDHLRDRLDRWREGLRGHKGDQDKSDQAVKDSIPHIVTLYKRYQDAEDSLKLLTPGTDAYREAVKKARRAHQDYNDALHTTAIRSHGAQEPVNTLAGNIANVGGVSAATAKAIAEQLNSVLKSVGAKEIHVRLQAWKAPVMPNPYTGHAATGGVLRSGRLARFAGGMVNPYGSAGDDHLVLSPAGVPIAAFSGTEGIVNAPQMGVIDHALAFTKAATGMPWGSLGELWGSGMRHFQTGGGLQPAIRQLSNRLDRMFGLTTTSGYRTSMPLGHPDYHNFGLAADISGSPAAMTRAVRYIMSSGLWHSLLEGIHNPGLSIKNGQRVPPGFWGGQWAQHIDHIHLALRSLAGQFADMSTQVRMPRITGPQGPLLDVARGGARRMTRAANRYLDRVMARMGGADVQAMGADANVVAAFRRAIRTMNANRTERLALFETGIVESGLRNLPYGDRDSLGSLQERTSIYGRAHALNPYASAIRFLTQAQAKRPWRGSAGALAQAVQVSAYPGRYDQARGQAMRYLQGGGTIASRARRIVSQQSVVGTLSRPLDRITAAVDELALTLERVSVSVARRSRRLFVRLTRVFDQLTGDNGTLDRIHNAVEQIATNASRRLQNLQFRVTGRGPRRALQDPTQIALDQLTATRATGTGLRDERSTLQDSLDTAQRDLRVARQRSNDRAAKVARAAIANLKARIDQNATDLAQNAQDQVEAQEAVQQAILDAVNTRASRRNDQIDRTMRMAKALGQSLDPNVVLHRQIVVMQNQVNGLRGVLAQAVKTGNRTLATQVRDQIDELNTSIAEAVAQQFQNSVDAVNTAAQEANTRLDRQTRLAQLGGQTDYTRMGQILGARGDVLNTQIAGLSALQAQALAAGNMDQYKSLADQIDELNTQLAENTQAIKDNTDAAFDDSVRRITERASFVTGILGAGQSFFAALGQRTGVDTTTQQATTLQGAGQALATAQGGLKERLAKLLGYTPDEAAQLQSLAGGDLVSYVLSLSSGPAFDAIMARLDPTQQQSFQNLLSALVDNATATEANTKALQDLTGAGAQSFSSSLWANFRRAVFTGAGGLLPQYQLTVPSADIGARVMSSGALMVHAGEIVRPAVVSRDVPQRGGDVYNLNLTSPTQVLDPVDVNRQLAFLRRTSGR